METMREKSFVVVEGPIGVGKTTLCRLLARRWGCRAVMEEFEENPFLPRFYQDRRAYAFQTQIFFMLNRFRQQQKLAQLDLFSSRLVTDYMFAKDRIFAAVNLSDNELDLYDALSGILRRELPEPDLVIFLQASVDTLLRRIDSRGRSYERNMSRSYMEQIVEAYNDYFFRQRPHHILLVNTDRADFSQNEESLRGLLEAVESHGGGFETYVPRLGEAGYP